VSHTGRENARAASEAVARQSYGKLLALRAARTRDVTGAEDALSDAFVAALADWPTGGVPQKPEAWLLTVARRKWIDSARRRRSAHDAFPHLELVAEELAAAKDSDVTLPDERLALMFACAHPAIWLGRLVAQLLPHEPEALGLLSLMLYAQARRGARRDARGEYVPLANQDPKQWDTDSIDEAEALLARASALPGAGRYQLEAAVQSADVVRRRTGRADWQAIERIYAALFAMTGSPVVAINRAVAVAEIRGAAAGLEALDALSGQPRLSDYQPYWAARAELLSRTGEREASQQAFERAIGLESDPAVRRFLQRRQQEEGTGGPPCRRRASSLVTKTTQKPKGDNQ